MRSFFLVCWAFWITSTEAFVTKYGVKLNMSEDEIGSELRIERSLAAPRAMANPNECADDAVIIEKLLQNYDKHKIPGGGHVKVNVELWIQEVSKIIEITSEFELDLYVTEMWNDPSLAFQHLNPCKHVWHNYRIKLIGPCSSTLRTFPIDQQRCMLYYESFSHNYAEVQMEWTATPITILKENITLPDYVLVDFKASSVRRLYPPGLWNELVATFTFQRLYGFYILQVYIPAYISVFMSWISFQLGPKNTPSRTTIGVNALLSLTYQFGSVIQNLPKTSDVKAIDVMILVAMGFIFASLMELAVVGYLTRKEVPEAIECRCSWLCMQCPQWTAMKIDKASSILFPICFIIFNIWYWFLFLGRV
ncbi:hypothetical protein M3Y99_01447200 [Aphelenchoides fujianensis]|nr:hypothetical protein M3Y99_01447200 [Aphelenchoides fujianensis]